MPVGACHGWTTRPETQASTPEQSGKVMSFRAGGVHKLLMNLAVSGKVRTCKGREAALGYGPGVNAIPWFKQIQKVFICGLVMHNKKSPAQKGEAFSFDAWQ
jgi:hypothetical protein